MPSIQLRDFASSVLYADTLDEKLAGPDAGIEIIDTDPGSPLVGLTKPGRPTDLRMRRDGVRANFPSEARLINEESRALLMHFFANHEMIAVELMALVLLKFPDAPKRFRKGIYQTLREEQMHTRWYVNRMKECGVEFGAFPVSSLIWDQIASMESPLDYVSRLSLTFEQANLDYAKHYTGVLADVGDTKTAKILDRIYRDEISHVGYGLHWFRKWKDESRSDWEQFRRQLKFPLSPVRAKSIASVPFNPDGRIAAGLDAEFIDALQVFEMSRGRTPDVYFFNPGCEAETLAPNSSPHPATASMANDLDILPLAFARKDDVVLVRKQPTVEHLQRLRDAGFTLPEFVTDIAELSDRKIGNLRPWGWSPTAREALGPLTDRPCALSPDFSRKILSKRLTVKLQNSLRGSAHVAHAGITCREWDEVASAVKNLRSTGHASLVW